MPHVSTGDIDTANQFKASRKVALPKPQIKHVAPNQVREWLIRGFTDFKATPITSLLYGALYTLACIAIFNATREMPSLTLGFMSGLLILGPFLAVGLYSAAKQIEAGEKVSIRSTFRVIRERALGIGLLAVFLAILMIAWLRISTLLMAVNVRSTGIGFEAFTSQVFQLENISWLALYALIGALFAGAAFVTNLVALPLIMDKGHDTVTAVITSIKAFSVNRKTLLLWGAAIVGMSLLGIVTYFLAFAVIFPVLGYATWHSYRDMIE